MKSQSFDVAQDDSERSRIYQKCSSKVKTRFFLKTFKFLLVILTFAFLILTFFIRDVVAQQVSLAISPPLLELVIKPSKSVLIAYQLENFADPAIITSTVLPFEAKDDLGQIQIKKEFEGPIRFGLDNSEIKLDQPFFLKTRQAQQLLLRIRVPEGTPEGDYYYTLLSQSQAPPTKEGATSNRVKASIGANILITVTDSGYLQLKGKISLFEVLAKLKFKIFGRQINIFDSSDKIPVVLTVENNGKNVIKPEGEIILRGNFGETASFDILPDNILAGSQRLLQATPSAEFNNQAPATLLLSGFFIGRYLLSTTINFGEGTPNLSASTLFIAIPFKLIIGVAFALLISNIIIKKTRPVEEN